MLTDTGRGAAAPAVGAGPRCPCDHQAPPAAIATRTTTTQRAVSGRLTVDRPVRVAADRSTTSSTIFSFEITIAGSLRSSSNLRSSAKESSCSVARLLSAGISHIADANRGALHSVGGGRVWASWAYGAGQSLQRPRRAHGSRRPVVSSRRSLAPVRGVRRPEPRVSAGADPCSKGLGRRCQCAAGDCRSHHGA